jgi:hypothetical protein
MANLNVDTLVEAARQRTGLADFGPDTWQEGLGVLVKSLNEEAALNATGEAILTERIVDILSERLKFEQSWKDHPEIADEQIVRPVIGIGLGRSGSNALGFMMAQDPARRVLRSWEAHFPSPPPEKASEQSDPRIALAIARHQRERERFPEAGDKAPSDPQGPTECVFLLAYDFRSQLFEAWGRNPSYSKWLFACDMEPAYRFHKRVLQMLQWKCGPKNWFVRSPPHMHGVFELGRVYPDALFIQTHRNVDAMIPSEAALFSAHLTSMTSEPDEPYLGRHLAEVRVICLERLMAFRDRHPEKFFDIGFYEMAEDVIGRIRALYAWLGEELSDLAEQRMRKWWSENSEGRHGARSYDAARYGVDPAELKQRFAFYHDRFPDLTRKPAEAGHG